MALLLAVYKTPEDKAAFDRYYRETHAPLAKKIPGLRSFAISNGPVAMAGGASDVYFVACLTFDSLEDIQTGLASPEGQATAADLANFADAGVDLVMFDTADA